jgi:hypothetical protein
MTQHFIKAKERYQLAIFHLSKTSTVLTAPFWIPNQHKSIQKHLNMIRKRTPPPNRPLILILGLANLILRSLNSAEFSKKLRPSPKFTTAIACRKVRLAIARDITQLGLTAKTAIISI